MTELYLLIDDVRIVEGMDVVARTSIEGRAALLQHPVTHLVLDNDLGANQDMEGYDILMWAIQNDCVPGTISIISANPVAKRRIEAALIHDLGYAYRGGWWCKHTTSPKRVKHN